jgi:beta-galactosidase/beta-glucuronidase
VDGNKYTPTSGIWQTVWIEKLPLQYIADLDIETNLTTLMIRAHIRGVVPSTAVSVRASVESAWNHTVSQLSTAVDERIHIASLATTIPNPRLWSPASPFLYNLSVSCSFSHSIGLFSQD